jgi:hypothetical protein
MCLKVAIIDETDLVVVWFVKRKPQVQGDYIWLHEDDLHILLCCTMLNQTIGLLMQKSDLTPAFDTHDSPAP